MLLRERRCVESVLAKRALLARRRREPHVAATVGARDELRHGGMLTVMLHQIARRSNGCSGSPQSNEVWARMTGGCKPQRATQHVAGPNVKTYHLAGVTRGDPSKLLEIAALQGLAYVVYVPLRLSRIPRTSRVTARSAGHVEAEAQPRYVN